MTQYGIWGNLNLFAGMVTQIWLQNNYIVLPCKVGAMLLVFWLPVFAQTVLFKENARLGGSSYLQKRRIK